MVELIASAIGEFLATMRRPLSLRKLRAIVLKSRTRLRFTTRNQQNMNCFLLSTPKPTTGRPIGITKGLLFVSLLIGLTGCPTSENGTAKQKPLTVAPPDAIKLLVIGDTEIGPKLVRQWKAHQDGELSVENQSQAEWIKAGFPISDGTDLIIYPPSLLGELAEAKKISKLEYAVWNSDEIDKDSWLNHYRRTLTRYGNEPYAVPLGNPHFSMMYNGAKLGSLRKPSDDRTPADFELPQTWEQLELALNKLDAKLDLPLAEGWAGHTFISRVASNVRTRGSFSFLFDRSTMEPLIEQTPFLEALKYLKRTTTKRSLQLNPSDVFKLAAKGEAAVAMGWPTNEAEFQMSERDALAVGKVPGSKRIYDFRRATWKERLDDEETCIDCLGFGGLVASRIAETRHEDTATSFIKWVSDKRVILKTAAQSPLTGPVRASHLGDLSGWAGEAVPLEVLDEYAAVIRSLHERKLVVVFPRIPGSNRYYAAFDQGVRSAVTGEKTPEKAMAGVAKEWNQITDSLGRQKQIAAMQRESGY